MFSLLKDAKWTKVENSAVAGTSTLTSDILDMKGYDSIFFLADLGDVTDTSVLTLTALVNDTNDTVTPTTVTNTATITATATSADNKGLMVDVHSNSILGNRYAYCTLERATANAVVGSIWACQYNSRALGLTQSSTVAASAFNA